MDVREMFEHWYSDNGAVPFSVKRNKRGDYTYPPAYTAWETWKAAIETWACFDFSAKREIERENKGKVPNV